MATQAKVMHDDNGTIRGNDGFHHIRIAYATSYGALTVSIISL